MTEPSSSSRDKLIEMARHNLRNLEARTIEQAPDVYRVPVEHYFDQARWERELDQVFRRVPLMLAMTAEIPEPGDYKAMEAAGVPVLINRDADGTVRAFVNMCSHRGAQIMAQGRGNTHRFTCPYHAWSYNQQGELIGILAPKDFGDIDRDCHGLTALPVTERAGLIWVGLNPQMPVDFDTFLSGYDEVLEAFGFANWHFHDARIVQGPNWKIAYDGYLDLYHLPILHRNTFGPDFPNQALYYPFGPHQRVSSPDPGLLELKNLDESQWPSDKLINGVWTIFPHVSIASFDSGGPCVMISQLFPGNSPGESYTVQNYLMRDKPDEATKVAADAQFKFLEYVVQEEDYATGLKQQTALRTGAKPYVMFGRNEWGGQRFHDWVDRLLDADDQALPGLFRTSDAVSAG